MRTVQSLSQVGLVCLLTLFPAASCAVNDQKQAEPTISELRIQLKEIAMERRNPDLSQEEAESLREEFLRTLQEIRNHR